MNSGADAHELHLSLSAVARFARKLVLWGALIGVPAAALAYFVSSRSAPTFTATASIVAPKRFLNINLIQDEPTATPPLDAFAYTAVVHREDVLQAIWQGLAARGVVTGEPRPADLTALSEALRVEIDDDRLSLMMFVHAEAATASLARARSSSAAAAIIAWDDSRAGAATERAVSLLEAQQAALESQLQQLMALGDRASLAQTASISQLLTDNRQDLALARSQAAAARGALDLVQDAVATTQLAPRPLYDAVITFVLAGLAITVVLLARAAVRVRFSGPEDLAEASGLPLLAAFQSAPGSDGPAPVAVAPQLGATKPRRTARPVREPRSVSRSFVTIPFLKAHVDRALPQGGRLLVVGIGDQDGARPVAAALAAQYRSRSARGGRVSVATGPALLAAASAVEEAASADATVLVADPHKTSRDDLEQALEWLRLADATVIGIVSSPGRDPGDLDVGLRGTP
ncbi:MAG: hypothetical protein KF813_05080 [Trueperaceae bacterium]|nr:hypothetical protein [Trueperaceae bacterium]